MAVITITTNNPILQPLLAEECPHGVTFLSKPPTMTRGFDVVVNVTFDVKIAIDLTTITAAAFGAWVVHRASKAKGQHRIEAHGKQVLLDDADAPRLIAERVEHERLNEHDKQESPD